jgi:hypothetical protein
MHISIVVKVSLGCVLGLYLLLNGWMILKRERVYIPPNIKLSLWLARKIYGEDFAKQEQVKFIKSQVFQGKQMIIIGLIVILISLFPLFNM